MDNKIIKIFIAIFLLILGFLAYIFVSNRSIGKVMANEDIVYIFIDMPDSLNPNLKRSNGSMKKGEIADLLTIKYSKEARYYKIKTKDNVKGYVDSYYMNVLE